MSYISDIEKIVELLESQHITQEEFVLLKENILHESGNTDTLSKQEETQIDNLQKYYQSLKDSNNSIESTMQYEKNKLNISLLIFSIVTTVFPVIFAKHLILLITYILILIASFGLILFWKMEYKNPVQLYELDSLDCSKKDFLISEIKHLEEIQKFNVKSLEKFQEISKIIYCINGFSILFLVLLNKYI